MTLSELSQERAVELAEDFLDLTIRLRWIENKYGLDSIWGPDTLQSEAVRVLKPYAMDMEVAGKLLTAIQPFSVWHNIGRIVFAEVAELRDGFGFRASQLFYESAGQAVEDIASRLKKDAKNWEAAGSDQDGELSDENNHSTTLPASITSGKAEFRVTPMWIQNETWNYLEFSLEVDAPATVYDFLTSVSESTHHDFSRLTLVRKDADGNWVSMAYKEAALPACALIINQRTAPVREGDAEVDMSKDSCLKMCIELYKGFQSYDALTFLTKERVNEVQYKVLPDYGFEPSQNGIQAMRRAVNKIQVDVEIQRMAAEINALLSVPPQCYRVTFTALKQSQTAR
eukprot:gnl/TRDRNA2_/TRDRNA2_196142_c0_seq1.p1 gnl/TRDRNA2_/TRDRNA2_196142_c0~~gnl/TRDRNA2_/TRDRNA2_196142_c0_seq1.p1  ORF type:complete len:342 (+),score=59.40 gnl/TRDRNA2_/TRDRNA2_196142_c0_seq1:94-1119(+)